MEGIALLELRSVNKSLLTFINSVLIEIVAYLRGRVLRHPHYAYAGLKAPRFRRANAFNRTRKGKRRMNGKQDGAFICLFSAINYIVNKTHR